MKSSSLLFVMILILSSVSAGCIGERILHRLEGDDKVTVDRVCDEEMFESITMEIRATQEQLNDDSENDELKAKLEKLNQDLRRVSVGCEILDREQDDGEEREDRGDEKCYNDQREEVECEEDTNNSEDEEREEKCYNDQREEVECEESS